MGTRSGRGSGGGGRAAMLLKKAAERVGGLPIESERQQLDWKIVGDRVFVTAEKKESEKNWLETGRKIPTVEATFDLNRKMKSVYLNRIDALASGKGFGREVMKTAMAAFAKQGFKKARGFVRYADADSQGMMTRLGGKIVEETATGRYWEFDL